MVKYRVRGGLHIQDKEDLVYWKAIFKERSAPIQSGKVTVRLPGSLAGHIHIHNFASFGVSADARKVNDRTVEFVSKGVLPPGQELEVRIAFPHGMLDMTKPQWQQPRKAIDWKKKAIDLRKRAKKAKASNDRENIIALFGVLFIVLCIFMVFVAAVGGGTGGGSYRRRRWWLILPLLHSLCNIKRICPSAACGRERLLV